MAKLTQSAAPNGKAKAKTAAAPKLYIPNGIPRSVKQGDVKKSARLSA